MVKLDIHDIEGLLIIDESKEILFKKCYKKATNEFLKEMYDKVNLERSDITIFKDKIVVYKMHNDVCLILYSCSDVNDIFLYKCLDVLYTSIVSIFKEPVTKESVMKKYDQLILVVENFIYDGIVLEDDSSSLVKKVPHRTFEGLEGMKVPKGFGSLIHRASKTFSKK